MFCEYDRFFFMMIMMVAMTIMAILMKIMTEWLKTYNYCEVWVKMVFLKACHFVETALCVRSFTHPRQNHPCISQIPHMKHSRKEDDVFHHTMMTNTKRMTTTKTELRKSWWRANEELMKNWWRADEELMKNWWRTDEVLMKSWRGADEELMKSWWRLD